MKFCKYYRKIYRGNKLILLTCARVIAWNDLINQNGTLQNPIVITATDWDKKKSNQPAIIKQQLFSVFETCNSDINDNV